MTTTPARRALALGSSLVLIHVVDEALLQPQPGTPWQARVWGPAVLGVLVALAGATYLTDRRWLRSLLTALPATIATAHGATHLVQANDGLDVTGVGMLVGGVVLLLLAAGQLVRRRATTGRRWRSAVAHLATALTAVAVLVTVLVPVAVGTVQVNLPRRSPAGPPGTAFETITLRTGDGVRLSAWYHPSTNGAAVVLLSSARGDHQGVDDHARLLVEQGYGVLVFDARGTGASDGVPNGWGWTWPADVDAALDHVLARPDVERVGLLGLSTGADVALEVAAQDPRVAVVVADGATAQGFADRPPGLLSASAWPMYATARALTGTNELPPLEDAVAATAPRPVLLVAAGSIPQEIPLNERYADAGGRSIELWTLPDVEHTEALHQRPAEYVTRVLGFLEDALLDDRR